MYHQEAAIFYFISQVIMLMSLHVSTKLLGSYLIPGQVAHTSRSKIGHI